MARLLGLEVEAEDAARTVIRIRLKASSWCALVSATS